MARIIREERRQRGIFGWIVLVLFWAFNAYMIYVLFAGVAAMNAIDVPNDQYSKAGAAIGTTLGIGMILFVWGFGAMILGLMALLTRGKTIVIERAPSGVVAAHDVDTARWSEKDRLAYEADRRTRREPDLIPAPRTAQAGSPEPARDYRELDAPITALMVLAQAGQRGLDQSAIDAMMIYLEAENGGTEYSRRQAAQILEWMHSLPSDEETIRAAVRHLLQAVGSRPAFLVAITAIAGEPSTERQGRWLSALRRQMGATS